MSSPPLGRATQTSRSRSTPKSTPRSTPGSTSGSTARSTANRPGRPSGGDSDQTRQRLLDVARRQFAIGGFAATALTSVAVDAELTPAALYYYFSGKTELYEAVYHTTAPAVWGPMEAEALACDGMVDGIEAMVRAATHGSIDHVYQRFLSAVPTVAQLHPEFGHLLVDRRRFQDRVFTGLAAIGSRTGELGPLSEAQGAEFLRVALMGYFFERYHESDQPDHSVEPLIAGLRAIGRRATPRRS